MPLAAPPPRENRFGSPLELSRVHWVQPEVVVEVTYLTWTEGGLLRAVSYQGQREEAGATGRAADDRIGAMKITALTVVIVAIAGPAASQQKIPGLPDDVWDLITRRASCNDRATRGVLDADLRATLRCNDVPKEEAVLREHYRDNAAVLAALDGTWKKIVIRVPVVPAKEE